MQKINIPLIVLSMTTAILFQSYIIPQRQLTVKADNHDSVSKTLMDAMEKMMERMEKLDMTADADQNFALMMIEHHKGAIDMTKILLDSGTDNGLKKKAENMMAEQQAEIEKLKTITRSRENDPKVKEMGHAGHLEMQATMNRMMREMEEMEKTGSLDRDYAKLMIQHHKASIEMARYEADHGKESRLRDMAKKMIKSQQKEIDALEKWLDQQKN